MVHTYEVLVDIKEYPTSNTSRCETTRYEIDAESREKADNLARFQARSEHPQCIECDARVTRLLK